MLPIRFSKPNFGVKKENGKEWIFDSIRKRWVRLTPEEWVRQNFIVYLTETKKYPASLLAIEKGLQLGEVKKRCDIIVYKESVPWMIVECKEPGVPLTEATLMQAIGYNLANCCCFLIISNGNSTLGWRIENGKAEEIEVLPDWHT
jgi:hypothetical protein